MRSFRPPQPSPPETGGEGVSEVTKLNNHKAKNRFRLIPSPPALTFTHKSKG
jgi:hypothetical protein